MPGADIDGMAAGFDDGFVFRGLVDQPDNDIEHLRVFFRQAAEHFFPAVTEAAEGTDQLFAETAVFKQLINFVGRRIISFLESPGSHIVEFAGTENLHHIFPVNLARVAEEPVNNGNAAGEIRDKAGDNCSAGLQYPVHLGHALFPLGFLDQVVQRPEQQYGIELTIAVHIQICRVHNVTGDEIIGSGLCLFLLCLFDQVGGQVGQDDLISFRGEGEGIGAGAAAQVEYGAAFGQMLLQDIHGHHIFQLAMAAVSQAVLFIEVFVVILYPFKIRHVLFLL